MNYQEEYNSKIKENVGKVLQVYATHKYTHEDGGAQDNQYIDVRTFLKNAFNNNDKNSYFLAICDGDYYLHKDAQTNCRTRIERLNKICGKTSFAMQINELKEFLSKFN